MSETIRKPNVEIIDPKDPYISIVGHEAVGTFVVIDQFEESNSDFFDCSGMVPGGKPVKTKQPETSFNLPA